VCCRKKNNIVYMKEHGFAEEMLDGLLNLDLALQCDGFVSSINSNWAR
jgi:glycoprotein 6-alpha-L-fucosyltransferase/import inner membrane translocase subunit TIM50